ncbi:MAG: hypothetical protein IPI00_13855 [Flavobacteriales bacterium]|nr:hypothetical protein [Flavobacteriales bacterium]MBK6944632.1 hypothetical protein [Flavobacteriales bacterium]MBK7241218.1 hypothetical protein [Flavobacteriales bacterium]MBK7295621.1 hypothetical protein [Flavobacteriales bacterium]MBK9534286.1 hypothetical protein [Flavobacteriales bacterium]
MAKKKPNATIADAVKTRARRAAPKPAGTEKRTEQKPAKRSAPNKVRKGYDADKYTGAIPGLAERMKEYLEHMRDDR